MRLNYAIVFVSDMARSVAFYRAGNLHQQNPPLIVEPSGMS